MKHSGHENKINDHQLKKLLIFKQILLVSTFGNVQRTVWRICILMLGCKGLNCELVLVLGFSTAAYYIIGSSSCEKLLKPLVNRLSNNPPPNNTFISLLLSSKPTGKILMTDLIILFLQALLVREQHATTHACSRLSTKVEGTPAVQGSTQNGPGAPLLLIMTWTNCGDTVVDAEVKIILNTKRPTVQLFLSFFSIEHTTVLDAQVILNFVSPQYYKVFPPSPRTLFFYFTNFFKLKEKKLLKMNFVFRFYFFQFLQ